jgi:hypothetical protein
MEVGSGQHFIFMADIMGSDTEIEHRPNPQKSLITAIFFWLLWDTFPKLLDFCMEILYNTFVDIKIVRTGEFYIYR